MQTRSMTKQQQQQDPVYPASYEESDRQDSGFTEYDFYEASQAWRRNKKSIGGGMYIYRSNPKSNLASCASHIPPNTPDTSASSNASVSSKMWYVDSDSD